MISSIFGVFLLVIIFLLYKFNKDFKEREIELEIRK